MQKTEGGAGNKANLVTPSKVGNTHREGQVNKDQIYLFKVP